MGVNVAANNCLGRNLRFLRHLMALSQEEVAGRLHMSRTCYLALESGSRPVTAEELKRISKATKITEDELMGIDLRKEMVLALMDARLTSNRKHFVEEYFSLSEKGRHLISGQIRRLASEEMTFRDYMEDMTSLL
ncbi:MAG: helix-turn-helix transcriptional regulator [Firmicutes bacterium]|nr:helix-turn-helix transcriptional regulator [Bacillota bacterium]